MYFPTAVAKTLKDGSEETISMASNSPRKTLFLSLTKSTLSIWRVRPPVVLASLSRAEVSLKSHGENLFASWAPDGGRIVIQTSASHLVLIRVQKIPSAKPYQASSLPHAAQRRFLPGPGEGQALNGYRLSLEGVVRIHGDLLCVSPRTTHILFTTKDPPAVQRIPWPTSQESEDGKEDESVTNEPPQNKWIGHDTWLLEENDLPWLVRSDVTIVSVTHNRSSGVEGWVTSDGRAYYVFLFEEEEGAAPGDHGPQVSENDSSADGDPRPSGLTDGADTADVILNWSGACVHGYPRSIQAQNGTVQSHESTPIFELPYSERATSIAFNSPFSLVAVGTEGGRIYLSNLPINNLPPLHSQLLTPPSDHRQHRRSAGGVGSVLSMEWTSDGYALAVGWERSWGVYSVGGRCVASGLNFEGDIDESSFEDAFMDGVVALFWAPGNLELFVLAPPMGNTDSQMFIVPFAKSTLTSQQSPDNTRYAVLQMDQAVMIYRGADQPDMSVINPEADVWQHVKVPLTYMATNWPIRYVSISNDGRLLAVAGRRGLIHWSAISGRWKSFADVSQEQAFMVRGGFLWYNHVLIVAIESSRSYQIRLYSRDLDLAANNILHREVFTSPVALLSLVDNSLLVYTVDNTLFHFLILPTEDSVTLHLCGSISFEGIVALPSVVRGMSWMLPPAQKQIGEPANDLTVATILLLLGGRLVLLRPRKVGSHEVKYDMQILAERIEFCWIHLGGIGALENSLWGYDGTGVRIWLDALTIEAASVNQELDAYHSVQESVNIPLNFYPMSVLMDKGIIIGVEQETAARASLPFAMFRTLTSTHLFLHHVLRYHLDHSQLSEAVAFASNYQHLVFFAHALEVLLHTVLEAGTQSDSDMAAETPASTLSENSALPLAIEFLDHFDSALDVVVACARKTEMSRWRGLFDIVGNPKTLFETCLESGLLKTAGSYLLVLHNLEQLDETHADVIRLLRRALEAPDWVLCRELMHFLRSIDETGAALEQALVEVGMKEEQIMSESGEDTVGATEC
ncbi:hypothetical protein BS47DRAFT_1287937 [Hydnum rufescens UP504]|uniref:RIC1 C-terminal alpha solenoid region domain-containing protein n=1 Tax=Hydnum rufescens UP504 TaxID=1448309 RepID=A0A9P6DYR9_9AGAM|nr:hypothetical protein BS47DRAFT_1287937 [Hydnum rufescens UP504]